MKNKTKIFGIIAFTAMIVFTMTACDFFDKEKNEVDTSQYYLDPPTGIVATKQSNNQIHLTWNAVSGAGHYEVTFRTNEDSDTTRRGGGYSYSPTNTRYEHSYYSWYITSGVTTLYYYVKAHPSKSGYIASDWSAPVSVDVR